MDFAALILLSIGLSLDSFAVSISCGLMRKQISFLQAFKLAFFLALFQASMPVIGWLGGIGIKQWIDPVGHWVAFGLLSIIGIKMIIDSRKDESEKSLNPLDLKYILGLSIATSIDALAVGVSFAIIEVNMLLAFIIIGFITFVSSMLGIRLGKGSSCAVRKRMEVLGGCILIAIGIKILIQHFTF